MWCAGSCLFGFWVMKGVALEIFTVQTAVLINCSIYIYYINIPLVETFSGTFVPAGEGRRVPHFFRTSGQRRFSVRTTEDGSRQFSATWPGDSGGPSRPHTCPQGPSVLNWKASLSSFVTDRLPQVKVRERLAGVCARWTLAGVCCSSRGWNLRDVSRLHRAERRRFPS